VVTYSTVFFDLFGTLVDDFASSAGQMPVELAAALGVPHEQFLPLWNQTAGMRTIGAFQTVEASIEYVCDAMNAPAGPEQINAAVEIRMKYIRQALQPRPNAVDTLTELKNQGYKIGLISNCSIEIPILWQETAFAHVIDTPIFSSRECVKKPDIRIYHLACERLGIMPESCIYIADGEDHELAGASKAGLHPVLIRMSSRQTSGRLHEEAREWQGVTITSFAEVLELVK
jgi:putative hydrolase of the HAD superfamily